MGTLPMAECPYFSHGCQMNFQALNDAAERAYSKGENIIVSLNGSPHVVYLPGGALTASPLECAGETIALDEDSFAVRGFSEAVPATMSAKFFEEEHGHV